MASKRITSVASRALAAVNAAAQGLKELRRDAKTAKARAKQIKDGFKAARKLSKQARKRLRRAEQALDKARRLHRAAVAQAAATKKTSVKKAAARKHAPPRSPLKSPETASAPKLRQRRTIARTIVPLVPIPAAAKVSLPETVDLPAADVSGTSST
jgi:hypothetical protein